MFKTGDVVRFDKAASELFWSTWGKRGRKFEVVTVTVQKGKPYYSLRNTVTGSVQKWIGQSLIKKAD